MITVYGLPRYWHFKHELQLLQVQTLRVYQVGETVCPNSFYSNHLLTVRPTDWVKPIKPKYCQDVKFKYQW